MTTWSMRVHRRWLASGMACLLAGLGMPAIAQSSAAAASHGSKALQAQLREVQAEVSGARGRNSELQAQVAKMERQNAEREQRLKQRDAEIAVLQQKLEAEGGAAAASSTGH